MEAKAVRVVMLAGLGRSGTTLLERALGELTGVQPLGEVIHLWRRSLLEDELCGCGRPFSRCPFWRGIGAEAFGGWGHVDADAIEADRAHGLRLRHIPILARGRGHAVEPARRLAEMHRRVYAAAARVTGAAAVVDSSKHPALPYALRQDPGIDLRVVHVVRDSRGVAYSWSKRVERPEAADRPSERWMTQYGPAESALLWLSHNAAVAGLRRLSTPVLLVRYESFVAEPARTLAEVAAFAGLELADGALDHATGTALRLEPAHTASGNPLRFRSGVVDLHPDEAWRSGLPPGPRRLVTALTLPQLVAYGYATGMRWSR